MEVGEKQDSRRIMVKEHKGLGSERLTTEKPIRLSPGLVSMAFVSGACLFLGVRDPPCNALIPESIASGVGSCQRPSRIGAGLAPNLLGLKDGR